MLNWYRNNLLTSSPRFAMTGLTLLLGLGGLAACGPSRASAPSALPKQAATSPVAPQQPAVTDAALLKCDGGDREGCFTTAVEFFYGRNGRVKDMSKSFAMFKKLCDSAGTADAESSSACFNVGVAYEHEHGVERDLTEAAAYYERTCAKGEADGCNSAGDAYELGEGVPRDLQRAKTLFESGCKLDSADSCVNLAFVFTKIDERHPDIFPSYRRACDVGSMIACHNVAANYASGDRIGRDLDRAKLIYTHACDQGFEDSCEAKREMEREQSYRRTGPQMAKLEKACRTNSKEKQACRDLGYMSWNGINVPEDEKKSAYWYELGCKHADAESCYRFAMMLDGDTQITVDMKRAMQLYDRACTLNSGDACFNLGVLLERGTEGPINLTRAFELFVKACKIGDKADCSAVASAYSQGRGVAKDMAMAAIHYEMACAAGKAGACYNMGVYYENGTGVAKDQGRAAGKFSQACKLGDEDGCQAAPKDDQSTDGK